MSKARAKASRLVHSPPVELTELHRRNNRSSADNWDRFRAHRERLTELVLAAGGESLAVLGAGNCNDLDLPQLTDQFREIHLVDIDGAALQRAKEKLPACAADKLRLHAPLDLSGALPQLERFRREPPDLRQLAELPGESARRASASLPFSCDTVVSACLLSQLMFGCEVALGRDNPQLPLVGCAVAVAHLRSLVRLIEPGGTGLLVTDVATSTSYPLAAAFAQHEPLDLLARLEDQNKALSGTAASFVLEVLEGDAEIAPLIEPPRLVEPWLWEFGEGMTLLVYACVLRRKPFNFRTRASSGGSLRQEIETW